MPPTPMPVTIAAESPLTNDAATLIEGSEAALRAHYTAEECFSFDAAELAGDDVRFYVARRDGTPVGCVALVDCGDYGEVKRLYVPDTARGLGVAGALMDHLEAEAAAVGLSAVRLETGDKLKAAVGLYTARGYARRGPFGDYADIPASTFMEKQL